MLTLHALAILIVNLTTQCTNPALRIHISKKIMHTWLLYKLYSMAMHTTIQIHVIFYIERISCGISINNAVAC